MYTVLNTLLEYTYFTCQKTLLHTLMLLVFKIVESFQCILKGQSFLGEPKSLKPFRKQLSLFERRFHSIKLS